MTPLPLLAAALAIAPTSDEPVDYDRDVRQVLEANCLRCHGPRRPKGGLRLDRRADALRGGDSGAPALVPGRPGESRLLAVLDGSDAELVMPPRGDGPTEAEVELLRRWIAEGGAYGAEAPSEEAPLPWSFRPLADPAPPAVGDAAWARNPIDRFVLARLEEAGLAPSPEADRATLARRLSLVMHGLPPAPEDVAAFEADAAPDAFARLVDRALASPHYGERWGRHWLDLARFAETSGFETNTPRPEAWPYRDWVIRAFNEDLPYDEFVVAQLAGDATGHDAATGFLVAGPYDTVKSPDVGLTLAQRQDELADMVNATTTAFLGLTVACARCHDHEFDPISQRDYYAVQAVFAGVQHGTRPLPPPDHEERLAEAAALEAQAAALGAELDALYAASGLREPVSALGNEERFAPVEARFVRFTVRATNTDHEPCLDELEVYAGDELVSADATPSSSDDYAGDPKHLLAHLNDGRYGNGRSWISGTKGGGWAQLELTSARAVDRVAWARDREGVYADRLAVEYTVEVAAEEGSWTPVASSADRLPHAAASTDALLSGLRAADRARAAAVLAERAALEARAAALRAVPRVYGGTFEVPPTIHRLHRGDPMTPLEEVGPDAVASLGALDLAADASEPARRLAFARWVASPDNPLTARVIVNRVWMHHFGEGLVDTPSDFGAMGASPTHPALLDWLARDLIAHDWSLAHLQRRILTSSTWRQASASDPAARAVDADARLLWRFPPRRVEAEVVRDTLLAASGLLDRSMGGPGFDVFAPNDNYVRNYVPLEVFGPEHWRRAVYRRVVRMEPDPTFGAFDAPDAGQVCPERPRSTTALQALHLFNSPFVLQQAEAFAARLAREAPDDVAAQVARAFRICFARDPDADEAAACVDLAGRHGLAAVCRALLNTHELVTLR